MGGPTLPSSLPPGAVQGGGDSSHAGAVAQRGVESAPALDTLTCRRGVHYRLDVVRAGQATRGRRAGRGHPPPVVRPSRRYGAGALRKMMRVCCAGPPGATVTVAVRPVRLTKAPVGTVRTPVRVVPV